MPEWLTYTLVKDFQTAIVGVIGFFGVIVTLVTNAWLAREQHKRERIAREYIVRTGIRAELEGLVWLLEKGQKYLQKRDEPDLPEYLSRTSFFVPKLERTISPHLIAEIGLLEEREISIVVKELNRIDHLNSLFATKAIKEHRQTYEMSALDKYLIQQSTRDILDGLKDAIGILADKSK